MNKRRLHHVFVVTRHFKPYYFLIIAIVFFVIAAFALRNNNLTAVQLRDNVVKVDEQNGDVEAALRELRQFVYGHMHTDLSQSGGIQQPVQLKYRYERLVAAEKDRVSKLNEKVYTDAQGTCERQIPTGRIADRIPCVQDYVAKNTVKEQPIPDSLYKFDFQPPIWSADLAGLSLLAGILSGLMAVLLFGFQLWLRYQLKSKL